MDPADQLAALQQQIAGLTQQIQALAPQQAQAQPQAVVAAPGFKVKQPDTFDGRKTKVELWLFQVQQYFNATNLRENEPCVYYATNLLRGDAATWWRMRYSLLMAARPNPDPLPSWLEFQEQLTQQF